MAVNYTKEQTSQMIEQYQKNPDMDTIEHLARLFQKSKKSVIGKLSKEGVYRRQVYKTKTGDDPVTKAEIVSQIAMELDLEPEAFEGLEKAPKNILKMLLQCIQQ